MMSSAAWKEITPGILTSAVAHIHERFELKDFSLDFLTQQKCYKELHPVTPGNTPSAIFKNYMNVYELGLQELIGQQFDDLLQIGLSNADLLGQHPVEWAKMHAKLMIDHKPDRAKLWTKNVCDQQPMTKSTSPEDMDEFIYWREWRAPRLIVMQPSANVPYDAASAWHRENQENTERYLNGLSKRFMDGLVFHLDSVAGEAYVKLAKQGTRSQPASAQKSAVSAVTGSQPNLTENPPVAFISYSWDSEAHKAWVLDLATKLQKEGGVRVILDRWYLPPGGDKAVFMEKSVATSKFVILVCTPSYAERANNRMGGVGYEATIITAELAENINQGKFIPVLRDGDWKSSVPVWIKTKLGVNLQDNPYSDEEYQNLLRALHKEPLRPPPIGPKPVFNDSPPADQVVVPPEWAVRETLVDDDLSPYEREAIRRKLSIVRLHALHPRLTVWLTNRSDRDVRVKSATLWHGKERPGYKRLSYGVPSENRRFVKLGALTENVPIAFVTDDDATLKLQSLGIVARNLPIYTFIDDADVEVRIEYDLLGVDDEYRETVGVRVHGNRQIESL